MPWVEPGSRALTESEMQENAKMIYGVFSSLGWTLNSICGMLGNFQTESSINPTRWQGDIPGEAGGGGYGLAQWTPWTKLQGYANAIGGNWQTGDTQCRVIEYNINNGQEYYATTSYPLSGANFRSSNESPEYLAYAFMYNYERPADLNQPWRQTYARQWYNYLSGITPPEPPTPTPTNQKRRPDFPWFLFMR